MMPSRYSSLKHFAVVAAFLLSAAASFAQEGKLKVHVSPKQAYLFVDGNAVREGSQTISLAAGAHKVGVYNYGYKPAVQDVTITADKTTDLNITLAPAGGTVNGPWGRIEIQGHPRAAVLLNGKTPDYFVGHVDEFDWDWIWKQELVVPPGTHQLTVTREGKTIWSGAVKVEANQKVSVNVDNGQVKTTSWPRGGKLKSLPRFKAGLASTTVAVAPVSGSLTANPTQINCGDSSKLTWSSEETAHAEISNVGEVAPSGEQSVTPKQTTNYDFSASGPGGVVHSSSTVNVNTAVQATLTANPAEVHYRRIGDKVVQQDSATLTWTTANASTVTLDPLGSVEPNGNRTVQAAPKQTTNGPVDENASYTLNASNVCGGSATQTANLHIVGSIEPIPTVAVASIFYPTDYPDRRHPSDGLLRSQQQGLSELASTFKKYLEYDPSAKLSVIAHADIRGGRQYNLELSERRAARVKDFLAGQGIPADKIETSAVGKDRQLDRKEAKQLEEENPNKAQKWSAHRPQVTWLAYNRRVDLVLQPSGKESTRYYPNAAADAQILWEAPKPSLKTIARNQ